MSPQAHQTFRTVVEWVGIVGVVVSIGSCMTAPSHYDIPEIECIRAKGNWGGSLKGCQFGEVQQ